MDLTNPRWAPRLRDVSLEDSLSGESGHHSSSFHLNTFTVFVIYLDRSRFSTEDVSAHSPEHKAKPSMPTSARAARPRSDWLGLKQQEEEPKIKEEPKQTAQETLKPPASPSRKPSSHEMPAIKTTEPPVVPSSPQTTRQQVRREDHEDDDWLSGALSRKKTQFIDQPQERERKQESSLVLEEEVKSNTISR